MGKLYNTIVKDILLRETLFSRYKPPKNGLPFLPLYGNLILMNFLWGLLNGVTAWPLLILHIFGVFSEYPVYNASINTGWYQFGFLIGAGSPILGFIGKRK